MTNFIANDICASRGRKQLLHNVGLPALESGDILGLLGPNAAGKSTLLAALSQQLACNGRMELNHKTPADWGQHAWQERVALMPQALPQPSSLTPYELMWSAARAMNLHFSENELAKHVEHLLHKLGLEDYANLPLYALSGGKRQLTGLALALVRNPLVLLLDEPTSALDLHWRMMVLNFVQERLSKHGGIAVAALHDMDLALRYCNKLVLLDHGKVISSGEPEQVLNPTNLAKVFKVEGQIVGTDSGERLLKVSKPIT